jgi:hypothetical protein
MLPGAGVSTRKMLGFDGRFMTYIVAVEHFGKVAIVTDMGVSFHGERSVEDSALKTGVLFPGCIYGIAGAADEARRFIEHVRAVPKAGQSVYENWERVAGAISQAPPSLGMNRFEALVSSRSSGTPRIFKYDSSTCELALVRDGATVGKGSSCLDAPLWRARKSLIPKWMALLAGHGALDEWPSLYCLWLSQYSMSQDYDLRQSLRACGVGGLFHYIIQDEMSEKRQKPSVVLLSEYVASDTTIVSEFYKIACGEHVVVVDHSMSDSVRACWDGHSGADPRLREPSELANDVHRLLDEEARFFGFGYLDPEYFDQMFFDVPANGTVPVEFNSGAIHESVTDRIAQTFGFPTVQPLPAGDEHPMLEARRIQRANLKDV